MMGYDIDELDARFQMAVTASQDLQITLPCSSTELHGARPAPWILPC